MVYKKIEINILYLVFYKTIIMNLRSIIQLYKGIQLKTPLGRWNIHNHRQSMLKAKYATEDNCGISYFNYKNITQIQKNYELDDDDDNKYIYMMGYESSHT